MKSALARSVCLALLIALTSCAASYEQSYGQSYGQSYRQSYERHPMRSPGNQISVTYFYEALAPEGEWFPDPNYGWCWTPYDVSADWRPYSDGHWEYTDYGWSWASDEPWGWATYHYGRWFFDDSYGWVWVPGTEWAPAWVAWRYDDDYVGWAPLPPGANWDASAGLAFSDANSIQADHWCFVPRTHVLDVSIRVQLTSIGRNVTLLQRSRDATRYEVRDGRPANVGIDVNLIERMAGRQVPRVKVVDVDTPDRGRGRQVANGGVGFYRPVVQAVQPNQAPPPEASQGRAALPQQDLQRIREQKQRKLESDLTAEHARLAREQQNELRAQAAGPAAEEARKRHVAEQQALDAYAAHQRQVLAQRLDKQIVNPGKAKDAGKAANQGRGKAKGKDKGRGPDKGNQ